MRILWVGHFLRIKRKYKKALRCGILFLLSAALIFLFTVNRRLTPEAESLLKTELEGSLNERLNHALLPLLDAFCFDDVMSLEKDSDGDIRAIIINSGIANRIKMEMAKQATDTIRGMKKTRLTVPTGSLYGGALFSGKGGNITVKSVDVTAVSSEIETKLSGAGINQVLCEAYINVHARVTARLSQHTVEASVTVQLLLTQFISVGTVPSRYTVVETMDEDMIHWLESRR